MNTYETALRKLVSENPFLFQEFCKDTRTSGEAYIRGAMSYHTPEKAFRLTMDHYRLFCETTAHLYKAGWSVPDDQPPIGEYYRETPERMQDIDAEVKKHLALKPVEGEKIPIGAVEHKPALEVREVASGGILLVVGVFAALAYILFGRR